MSQAEWYILSGNKKSGPFTVKQIQSLLEAGKIKPDWTVADSRISDPTTVIDFLKLHLDPAYSLLEVFQLAREKRAIANKTEIDSQQKKLNETQEKESGFWKEQNRFRIATLFCIALLLFLIEIFWQWTSNIPLPTATMTPTHSPVETQALVPAFHTPSAENNPAADHTTIPSNTAPAHTDPAALQNTSLGTVSGGTPSGSTPSDLGEMDPDRRPAKTQEKKAEPSPLVEPSRPEATRPAEQDNVEINAVQNPPETPPEPPLENSNPAPIPIEPMNNNP